MTDEEKKNLEATLLCAEDLPLIKEIIREAELFLADQMKAALAADSRALTLAGILGAGVTLLTGNLVTVSTSNGHVWPYAWGIVVIIISMVFALFNAVSAAKPSRFWYSGNSPLSWKKDIEDKTTLLKALAGQAYLYSVGIAENKKVLADNQRSIRKAFLFAVWGIVSGVSLGALISIARISAGHFPN